MARDPLKARPADPPRRPFRWAVLIVAVVAVVFGRSVWFPFVDLDDDSHLSANPLMRPFTTASLAAVWSRPYQAMYIPATYTAWGLLAHVAEGPPAAGRRQPSLDPAVFHLANVVLHAANALIVWLVLRRVVGDGAPAVVGALAFAVHPVQAEPVAWVSGFKDTFSGFWSLLAVLLFLHAAAGDGQAIQWKAYAAATAAFAVALCAKPAAVVVPPIAWLLAWAALPSAADERRFPGSPTSGRAGSEGRRRAGFTGDRSGPSAPLAPRPGSSKGAAKWLIPWVLLAVPYVWMTHAQQADANLMTWNPPAVRPLVAADALAFYARQWVWPAQLCVDYGRTPLWVWEHAGLVAVEIVVLGLAVAAVLWLGRRDRAVAAGVAVAVVAAGPVLGLVPFLYQQFSTVSDRYLYLPMLGVAVTAAAAVRAAGRWAAPASACLLAALAARAVAQVGVWRDTSSLYAHNLTVNPRSALAHAGLGLVAERAGDLPAAERADRAAVELDGSEPKYQLALSRVLSREPGRSAEARAHYALFLADAARRVLALDPQSPVAHRSLAQSYALQGRHAESTAESALAARFQAAGHAPVRPPGDDW